ncbi:uncharacterized protein LAESUDRAFT_52412 [Laetiporus sulphureus 93-53]|uniref:Cytochrome P450 n=1 Tax=Laetiporus sulphureus 93-53 TaxID=1314785 RepID=A0A165FBU1_9APHY|nr:uncharacterized protein LAESUDRAFT_52412 [Laetiporus sulphureus 93-53]KZT08731.1 hypothetical protein LAESUDRAFT_52412 [Laetiporus sulphureus 93-53]
MSRPSQWYSVQERLTFFRLGPHACLGGKFALMVSTCLITSLLRDWKFAMPQKPGRRRSSGDSVSGREAWSVSYSACTTCR